MSGLERFIEAQKNVYETALNEIKNGHKNSCWMWYIFPQIKGLGMTQASQYYGIDNIEEAIDYLKNELLKTRLIEISNALLELEEVDIKKIMGFPDNLKLKSCMTLFKKAEELSEIKCDNIFQKILDKFFEGEDDSKTLLILEKQKQEMENNDKKEMSDEIEKEEINDDNKEDKIDRKRNKKNNDHYLIQSLELNSKEMEKSDDFIKKNESTLDKYNNKNNQEESERVEIKKSNCCDNCIII